MAAVILILMSVITIGVGLAALVRVRVRRRRRDRMWDELVTRHRDLDRELEKIWHAGRPRA